MNGKNLFILLLSATTIFSSCDSGEIDNDPNVAYIELNRQLMPGDTLDINGDLLPDYFFSEVDIEGFFARVRMTGWGTNLILSETRVSTQNQANSENFIRELPLGTFINPSSATWRNEVVAALQGSPEAQVIDPGILGKGYKYLGLAFKIDGNIHYGWIRLEMPDINTINVLEAAFHIKPTLPLEAGQK